MLSWESIGGPCSFFQLWVSLYFHIPFQIACGFTFRALHPCLGIPPYFMSSRMIGFEMVNISGSMNTRRLYKQQRPRSCLDTGSELDPGQGLGNPFCPAKMSYTSFPPGRLCLSSWDTRCLLPPYHPHQPSTSPLPLCCPLATTGHWQCHRH